MPSNFKSQSMEMGKEAKSSMLRSEFHSQFLVRPPHPPLEVDLTSQVGIITGGSSGLGLHCAHHLLSMRLSHLIITTRSVSKGEVEATKLRYEFPGSKIDVWSLEMESYSSIQKFCHRIDTDLPRLDFIILNARLMQTEFATCATGHERVIQVNYLSTFLLAILMLPISKKKSTEGKPGRITIVSSGTALFVNFKNHNERPFLASFDHTENFPWDPQDRYFTSKGLGHLFFARMQEYLNPDDVIVNLVEPGMCKGSALHREVRGAASIIIEGMKSLIGRSLDLGAWTYVDAAVVKGKESGGCFLMNWEINPFARFVYLPEGQVLIDTLWDETMAELEFAKARKILESLIA